MRTRPRCLVALAGALACGPAPGATTGATETTTTASSSTGATTGDDDSEPLDCSPLAIPASTVLTVTLTNSGDAPIYVEVAATDPELAGFFVARVVDLIDAESAAVVNARGQCHGYRRCYLDFWCPWSFAPTYGDDPCEPSDRRPRPLRLDPGASYEAPLWDGRTYLPAELHSSCQNQLCGVPTDAPTECLAAHAYAGDLIARVRVGAALDCGDDEPCGCEPDAEEGWCEASGGAVVGATPVDTPLSFPTDALTITIP